MHILFTKFILANVKQRIEFISVVLIELHGCNAGKMQQKSPVEEYGTLYKSAVDNLKDVKMKHGDAQAAMIVKMRDQYKFSELKDQDEAEIKKALKDSAVEYMREIKLLPQSNSELTQEMKDDLYSQFLENLQRYGQKESDIIEKIQDGAGFDVLTQFGQVYQRTASQRAHTRWYSENIQEKGPDFIIKMAKGYKEKHDEKAHHVILASDLEQRIMNKAEKDAQ